MWEFNESPGSDIALFTFGSFTNPGRTEPSYAFVNTVLRVKKIFGEKFDAYYLKARMNDWYFSGAQGTQSLQSSLDALSDVVKRYRRTIFLGNSMGGYAAMLFGLPLGADAILAFSPQTRFDLEFCDAIGETRWREAYDAMRAGHDADAMSMRHRWPKLSDAAVSVHYGINCKTDCRYAAELDGLPGVTTIGHPGCDHDLVNELRANGQLEQIIRDALSDIRSHSQTVSEICE